VYARKDDDGFTVASEEDRIREPAKKRSPGLSINYRVGGWMYGNVSQCGIDDRQELFAQPVAAHTTDTPPLYPQRRRGERAVASLGAISNPAEDLLPGNSDWSLAINFVQPPVQLLALGFGERDCLWRTSDAFPKLIEEPQPLFKAESGNVDGGHGFSIPHLLRCSAGLEPGTCRPQGRRYIQTRTLPFHSNHWK
jgi:hypothetical protein